MDKFCKPINSLGILVKLLSLKSNSIKFGYFNGISEKIDELIVRPLFCKFKFIILLGIVSSLDIFKFNFKFLLIYYNNVLFIKNYKIYIKIYKNI